MKNFSSRTHFFYALSMLLLLSCGSDPSAGGAGAGTGGMVQQGCPAGQVACGTTCATTCEDMSGTGGMGTGGMGTGGTGTGGLIAGSGGENEGTGGQGTGGDQGTGGQGSGGDQGTGGQGSGGGPSQDFPFTPNFILGADISWTLEQESGGAVFRDGGEEKSIERIFVDHGFNYVRLRTFVCPDCPGGYADVPSYSGFGPTNEAWCNTAHTIEMAQRVKACGMGLFLDFHMSDLWASIGEQHVPSAWAGMSPSDMQAAGYAHVKDVLEQMIAAGVKPDMVQVGNENNSRMSGVSINDWAAYSGLANAGTKAVRDTDPNIIVVVQHGRPREDGGFLPWVDKYVNNNPSIDFDWICGSTYGTTCDGCDWIDQFGTVINDYGVPVLSCEYTDQRRNLINPIMHDFPNNMGKGTFLWEPSTYEHPLFDRSGNTLTANSAMDQYPGLAESYGLPVPSVPASELEGTSCQ